MEQANAPAELRALSEKRASRQLQPVVMQPVTLQIDLTASSTVLLKKLKSVTFKAHSVHGLP